MRRSMALLYGTLSYAFFFVTFLYAIGFVSGVAVPKTIDDGIDGPAGTAMVIDLALLSLFAFQHSLMARRQFKDWWVQFVPRELERSTFVLFSTLALALLIWQWRPIPTTVWGVDNPILSATLVAVSFGGWLLVLGSTFLINHFELFGLQQVFQNFRDKPMPQSTFRTPVLYRVVRHPLYLGFIIAFWSAPVMSAGHLLFAAVTTAYILVGIKLEERDLVELFGAEYRRYAAQVPMLIPGLRAKDYRGDSAQEHRSTGSSAPAE